MDTGLLKNIANIFLIILLGLNAGCEEDQNQNVAEDLLVLHGYLYQGESVSGIQLSKTLAYESEDTVFEKITDAEIAIEWKDIQYKLQHTEDGKYDYLYDDLEIAVGDEYGIVINYNGQQMTSTTVVPDQPAGVQLSSNEILVDENLSIRELMQQEGGEIEITWDNPENDYFFVVVENIEEDPENIDFGLPSSGGKNFSFLSQPTKTNTYRVRILAAIQQYGTHLVKVYRVNQEYANLYENREQDSRNLSEPFSNVNNGLGIFTAFSCVVDSFEVKRK